MSDTPVPPPPPAHVATVHATAGPVPVPAPQGPKRYGVALVGPKFEFWYEDEGGGEDHMIEIRGRRSLTFEEHVAFIRQRAVIDNRANALQRKIRQLLRDVEALTVEQVEAEGLSVAEKQTQMLDAMTVEIGEHQTETWEMTQEAVLSLVIAPQQADVAEIIRKADPAHVTELLTDMEARIVARQQEETGVAARVDPTSPTPPSGS